jgi:hypothetical protein
MSETIKDIVWLRSATLADLKAVMLDPVTREQANNLLRTSEGAKIASEMLNDPDYVPVSKRAPEGEEAAAIAADEARAAEQAAVDAAAAAAPLVPPTLPTPPPAPAPPSYEAEDAEAREAGVVVTRDAQGHIAKLVQNYQVTDEATGSPIGRPTHLEAKSWPEMVSKQKTAHLNAVRFAERTKRNQNKSRELIAQTQEAQQTAAKARQEADEATQAIVKEKDPVKVAEAINKVTKADREQQIADQAAVERGKVIGRIWMADHADDFYACDANSNLIGGWLKENNLVLSYENLDKAFEATRQRLAPVVSNPQPAIETPAAPAPNVPAPAPVAPVAVPPSIPAPAAPAAEPVPPAAVPPPQPAVPAPAPTPAAAPIAQPPARRPGVNGSLVPGASSAARPTVVALPKETVRAELLKVIQGMKPEEYRLKLRTSKEFRAQHEAAGIPVLSPGQYQRPQ